MEALWYLLRLLLPCCSIIPSMLPHGPEWLLLPQPSYSYSNQQEKEKEKGYTPLFKGVSWKLHATHPFTTSYHPKLSYVATCSRKGGWAMWFLIRWRSIAEVKVLYEHVHFNLLRCIHRSGIARSYGNSVFNFWRTAKHCPTGTSSLMLLLTMYKGPYVFESRSFFTF